MRVLMIGGTGLIGHPIAHQLVELDHDVTIYGRGLSLRTPPGSTHVIHGDRTAPRFVDDMRDAGMFDVVIDMVCYRPEEAEAVVRAFSGRVGQYILTSTIDVYRKPATRYPYREDEPQAGLGEYASNKARCEAIVREAHERDGFPVTVIRPAATYGDRHLPVHSLGRSTSYLDRLRRGRPIVAHGDGSSFWVSCHADDVARAFARAVGCQIAIGRSYHVTGEEWVTWNEHHAAVARAVGGPEPTLVHIPSSALATLAPDCAELVLDNLQFNNIFDNDAAREDLGFRYTIPLAEGLPRWVASLERAGLIENSDDDPLDDRLIAEWTRLIGDASAVRGAIA